MSFRLMTSTNLEQGTGLIFEHTNGAQLIAIQNEDNNKVFSIAVDTPVANHSGIAHILEHCLFCGSQKYPVKDPFSELGKGSLYTYLNAMTFRDKTLYPVASCHEKDFYHLMEVYLDSVFFPLLKKEAFWQEGWHYNLSEGNANSFGGIVYNEMRGVYSDPVERLKTGLYERLFAGSPYAFDAGGIPEWIPSLSYEEFVAFYKTYYYPGNCFFYVYGDVDLTSCLEKIDAAIAGFAKRKPILGKRVTVDTPIPDFSMVHRGQAGKKSLGCAFVIGDTSDGKLLMAVSVLQSYLLETQFAPLKKALIHAKLGEDCSGFWDVSIFKPVFGVIVKNSEANPEELRRIIFDTIRRLVVEGLKPELLDACLNTYEFAVKELYAKYRPKGLSYNIAMLSNWMNDADPFDAFRSARFLAELRKDKEYFTNVLRRCFLENSHVVFGEVKSCPEIEENTQNGNVEEAAHILDSLTVYQKSADRKVDLESIPCLALSDVKPVSERIPTDRMSVGGVNGLFCPMETNGIVYATLLFDTSDVPHDLVPFVGVLTYLLGKLETKRYDVDSLAAEINRTMGGFSFGFSAFRSLKTRELKPRFILRSRVLEPNVESVFFLADEVLTNTLFVDKKRIASLLTELLSKLRQAIVKEGQTFALGRANAFFDVGNEYLEYIRGMEFYYFLKKWVAQLDTSFEEFQFGLMTVLQLVMSRKNLFFSMAGSGSKIPDVQAGMEFLAGQLPKSHKISVEHSDWLGQIPDTAEAFASESLVQYVAQAFDLGHTIVSDGRFAVLTSVLNSELLNKKVRLEGGAYGGHCQFGRNGIGSLYSYRDPHLARTLEVFSELPKFIENIYIENDEWQRYIMGTMNRYVRPKHVRDKADLALSFFYNDWDADDLLAEQHSILSTSLCDIQELGFVLEKAMSRKKICVMGSEAVLSKVSDSFVVQPI